MRQDCDDTARDARDILRFGGSNNCGFCLFLKQLPRKGSYLSTLLISTQQPSQRRQGRLHCEEDSQITPAFAKTSNLNLHATSDPEKDVYTSRTANMDLFNTMMII